jgi:hypothetical protein
MSATPKIPTQEEIEEVVKFAASLLEHKDEVSGQFPYLKDKINGLARQALIKSGIAVRVERSTGAMTFSRIATSNPTPATKMEKPKMETEKNDVVDITKHSMFYPPNYKRIKSLLQDTVPAVPYFIGPAGCAKTMTAEYLAKETGRTYFQFSCTPQTQIVHMMGKTELVTDKVTNQSITKFVMGTVLQAAMCGLDEDGNEVGQAALLCLDEFGSLDEGTALLFNGFWTEEARRRISYEGKTYHCHSNFRVVLTGNNAGRGNNSLTQAVYTAQAVMKDASTLDRVYPFKFGYMVEAEQKIMLQRTHDEKFVADITKFASNIRSAIKTGTCQTPFTTRTMIKIANAYRVWGDVGYAVRNAIYDGLANEEERSVYAQAARVCLGIDIESKCNDGGKIEYMD